VAKSILDKGIALGRLGRHEEAIAAYDDLLSRFGDSDDRATREVLTRAAAIRGGLSGSATAPRMPDRSWLARRMFGRSATRRGRPHR